MRGWGVAKWLRHAAPALMERARLPLDARHKTPLETKRPIGSGVKLFSQRSDLRGFLSGGVVQIISFGVVILLIGSGSEGVVLLGFD